MTAALTNALSKGAPTNGCAHSQGCSILYTLKGWPRFPSAEMSESMCGNPNRRLSHGGFVVGDFALRPGPPSRGREALRTGRGGVLRDPGHGCGGQFVPADARIHSHSLP